MDPTKLTAVNYILRDVEIELKRAWVLGPRPFSSPHEGFSILNEEVDELWDEVKKKSSLRDPQKLREEAIQIAAMAVRFIVELL